MGTVCHPESTYVGATTSEEEEEVAEADRYLRGWKGKGTARASVLFSLLHARSLMLSFVIVTPAHLTRPQCVQFPDTYYAP